MTTSLPMTTLTKTLPTIYPKAALSVIADIKRKGGRVFGIRPEGWQETPNGICQNCDGTGKVGIQVFTGGPYSDPTGKGRSVTNVDGKWYKQKTTMYTCPVCGGSGR